jgi:hypothetical protein
MATTITNADVVLENGFSNLRAAALDLNNKTYSDNVLRFNNNEVSLDIAFTEENHQEYSSGDIKAYIILNGDYTGEGNIRVRGMAKKYMANITGTYEWDDVKGLHIYSGAPVKPFGVSWDVFETDYITQTKKIKKCFIPRVVVNGIPSVTAMTNPDSGATEPILEIPVKTYSVPVSDKVLIDGLWQDTIKQFVRAEYYQTDNTANYTANNDTLAYPVGHNADKTN